MRVCLVAEEEVEITQHELPNRIRKRQKRGSTKQGRKKKRNLGQAYETKEGRKVPEKKFSNINCNCRLKCIDKISEVTRRSSFETFWNLGSFSCQNAFLCGLIKQMSLQHRRPRDGSRLPKSTSNQFYIQVDGMQKIFPSNIPNIRWADDQSCKKVENGRATRI